MSKKTKPKWGYKGRFQSSDDGVQIYAPEAVAQLAEAFVIEDHETLTQVLEVAATAYRDVKHNVDDSPRASEIRAAILAIEKSVDALAQQLTEMDDLTEGVFWRPEQEIDQFVQSTGLENEPSPMLTRYGHSISHQVDEDGTVRYAFLQREDHFESLGILKSYCLAALDTVSPDKGGRPSSKALQACVRNLKYYWESILERRFTLDYEKGEPISDAARFCCQAIHAGMPEISNSQVITAMKNLIEVSGKKPPRKRP